MRAIPAAKPPVHLADRVDHRPIDPLDGRDVTVAELWHCRGTAADALYLSFQVFDRDEGQVGVAKRIEQVFAPRIDSDSSLGDHNIDELAWSTQGGDAIDDNGNPAAEGRHSEDRALRE